MSYLPPYMDPELAASLALREPTDGLEVSQRRQSQREIWERRENHNQSDVELSYLQPSNEDGPPVRLRTYRNSTVSGDAPALLWMHGGAFSLGFCEIDDDFCSWISHEIGCQVYAPEYRLAPEHPFPSGFNDVYESLEWISDHSVELSIDRRKIAVGGASAGGNLAAAAALKSRDQSGPDIAFQLLAYPVMDDRMVTHSMRIFVDSPIFNRPSAELMWDRYLGTNRGPAHCFAAPARAATLAGLPPAYIATTELDPLRDEGLAFATRLIAAGVETELHHFPGTFHGFDTYAPTALISQRAWADYAAALRGGLGRVRTGN